MPLPPVPAFTPLANPQAVITAPHVRFSVLTDRLLRLEHSRDGQFEDRPSQVFWHRSQPVPDFEAQVTEREVRIETRCLRLRYRITPLGFTPWTLSITLKESGVTWHYGDSARRAGNLKGTARTLDRHAGSARLENGLISRAGWAVVDDSRSLVFNEQGWLQPRSSRRRKDLYFFGYGADVQACLADFTRLAGAVPMIPRYILGNWYSRYWAYTQQELQDLMQQFRAHQIPLSVCIVDMDWHITRTGNASDGWTGYTWNRQLFPDPPGFIHWLHSQGLRTALNLHPARGVYPHEEQYPAMARWMGYPPAPADADPARLPPVPFDLTDPRFAEGYFELLHHPYEEMGVDFWWIDWQQGTRSRLPGLDPLWWLNHLHFADLGRDGKKRPFIFSRWGGLGNHRYPIGFSGDTFVRWSALASQPHFTATAANVAYGWWSHDIGGHMFKDLTPELFVRWVQFGVFSPILRLHATNHPALDRRPWSKPPREFAAVRAAMQLRHALIPYLYSMAWRAHRSGISLVTPMYYGHMHQPDAFAASNQYFFGSELLAAPFLAPADSHGTARRRVWLPGGGWFHFFHGAPFGGDAWHDIEGQIEDIPVFARAGAIVPLAPPPAWGGIENPQELEIHVFPGAENRFDLYEDDGETTAYLCGEYALTPLSLTRQAHGWAFTLHPVQGDARLVPASRRVHILLRGVTANVRASLPGAYDPATRTYRLPPQQVSPDQTFTITFSEN